MTTLSAALKKLLATHELTVSDLAKQIGIVQPVLHRIVSGTNENPTLSTLVPIAKYFGITLDELIGGEPITNNSIISKNKQLMTMPILEWEQAKCWPESLPHQEIKQMVDSSLKNGCNPFALKVKDSTMLPRFPENTLLVFDINIQPKNKDFVLVQLETNTEPTFKQVFFDGEEIYLKPLNSAFKTLHIDKSVKYRFIGVLIEAHMEFKHTI